MASVPADNIPVELGRFSQSTSSTIGTGASGWTLDDDRGTVGSRRPLVDGGQLYKAGMGSRKSPSTIMTIPNTKATTDIDKQSQCLSRQRPTHSSVVASQREFRSFADLSGQTLIAFAIYYCSLGSILFGYDLGVIAAGEFSSSTKRTACLKLTPVTLSAARARLLASHRQPRR